MLTTRNVACTALALATIAVAQQTRDSASLRPASITSTGSTVTPTGYTLGLTVPGGFDSMVIVGSLIGTASALTTIAITCPEGVSSDDCPLDPPITVTAGSTTFKFTESLSDVTVAQACQITSGVGGVCTLSNIGPISDIVEETSTIPSSALSQVSTTTSNLSFGPSDIMVANVIITAGNTAGLTGSGSSNAATSTSASSSSQTHSSTSRSSSQSSGAAAATSSAAAPSNVKALAPGVIGAGLMGFLAFAL